MKNFQELITALLEDETITYIANGFSYKLNKEGMLVGCTNKKPVNLTHFDFVPDRWEVQQWHSRIPKTGFLCWVGLSTSKQRHTIEIITSYSLGQSSPFNSDTSSWAFATRLTPEEVTIFLKASKLK